MTNFNDLKRDGMISRGRKAQNKPKSNTDKYRIRAEARRRASLVLQHNHREEFELLVQQELNGLVSAS